MISFGVLLRCRVVNRATSVLADWKLAQNVNSESHQPNHTSLTNLSCWTSPSIGFTKCNIGAVIFKDETVYDMFGNLIAEPLWWLHCS